MATLSVIKRWALREQLPPNEAGSRDAMLNPNALDAFARYALELS